jgi:hypothetical protein
LPALAIILMLEREAAEAAAAHGAGSRGLPTST